MTQTIFITLAMIFSGYTGITSIPFHENIATIKTSPTAKISKTQKTEILWLARVIFSETKNKEEMRLVGWVVRNRVDTQYRGKTYKEVALSAYQFSGLNPKNKQYKININMDYKSKNKKWLEAIKVAKEIYFAKYNSRPFPKNVLHFYSPISLNKTPKWTSGAKLAYETKSTKKDSPSFVFYSGVR